MKKKRNRDFNKNNKFEKSRKKEESYQRQPRSNRESFHGVEKEREREDLVIGRNPVKEAINSDGTVEKILAIRDGEGSIKQLISKAKEKNIHVMYCDKKTLDRISKGENHQGIIAYVTDFKYSSIDEILQLAKEKNEEPFVVILDGITDPHNLGAIIRTGECAGVHGIIIPKRRAVLVNSTVVKTSAGATSYMKVAKVSNISRAIEELKEKGLWIYSCNMGGENFKQVNYSGAVGLVIGNEGSGLSENVQSKCDFTVSVPMKGKINSLNASNAAAIVMYEIAMKKMK